MWKSYRRVAGHCLVVVSLFAAGSATAAEAGRRIRARGAWHGVRGVRRIARASDRQRAGPPGRCHRLDGRQGEDRTRGRLGRLGWRDTRVRIDEYQRGARNAKARLALVAGALRLFVAKVTPDGNFEVETETATAAVRGTDWMMETTPEQTSVALLRGRVAVSGRTSQAGATVVLASPGQGTDVRRGSAPTPPIPWGARRFADTLARATFN